MSPEPTAGNDCQLNSAKALRLQQSKNEQIHRRSKHQHSASQEPRALQVGKWTSQ